MSSRFRQAILALLPGILPSSQEADDQCDNGCHNEQPDKLESGFQLEKHESWPVSFVVLITFAALTFRLLFQG